MENKQIKELMAAMARTGTKKMTLKRKDFELTLEREDHFKPTQQSFVDDLTDAEMLLSIQHDRAEKALAKGGDQSLKRGSIGNDLALANTTVFSFVTSPMVGVFYRAPAPQEPTFIKVGDFVTENTIVGIIEAMKVMNEIKAGVSGVVVEILVDSGAVVEFSTPLFRVEPKSSDAGEK